ncbi:hypothetical protein [Pedobacter endophyticus]|uniref:Prealbumin-like fold domain-containing protein n=1 Tax=Pedobacter endophyticus TaxID=2789740 RepID=A0A7S9L0W8_9SPHI|nr:hypothetical protein [Pedobacter endophyticus]QPH40121.1 hypothetical protein IZT61_02215 [Pedobacter endophyticus]
MKSKLTFLTLLLAVLFSCKKTTNVDLELSTSGKLAYKLTDDAGKAIPNVKVSLLVNNDHYSNYVLLDSRVTDGNGQADFGDLNAGNYQVVSDSARVNNIPYLVKELVQVTAGAAKTKETKVTDFSGTYVMSVKSSNNSQPLKNVGVLLIPSARYSYNSTTANQLKVAHFSGLTNDAGVVSFKVPSDMGYYVYVYNTVTNASYSGYGGYYSNFTVQRGATVNNTYTIY